MGPVTRGGGDGDGVAGVVVDEVEDLYVGAVGQPPVGEFGLPAFVGLLGGEADVGRFGALLRVGVISPAARRCRWMESADTCQAVVVF